MNRRTTRMLAALALLACASAAWAQQTQVTHGQAVRHDTSPPLSEMGLTPPPRRAADNREVPIGIRPDFNPDPSNASPDTGLAVPQWFMAPTPSPDVSAPGLSEADNQSIVGFAVVPPDTNGDIGRDDEGNRIYVQYINLVWGVFDDTGALIAGPFPGNSFWTGFGGPCENNNDGDPVVLYDDYAGRWFMSQFSIDEGIQCVAVSLTSDPLGAYYRYAFVVTPGGNNDYPKLGVWTDGAGQSAYTFTLRDFGGAGGSFSVSAGVFERDAMLVGDPASFVKFINPCGANDCIEGQLPPHMAGPTPPPAGTCPTFWTAVDAAYDDSPSANDGYRNHTLCVDWTNLANSTYNEGPLVVAGSNFDRFLGNGFSDCIGPVNGGEVLDCLAAFTMYRAQYRWFGDNARVVLNTTVDAGGDRAGIRWAEVRSADGDSGWFLQQDGTFAPDDGLERWMGSIAQDQDGNIALGYSVTGASLFPSVRYTSRSAGDPAGTMAGGEVSCHEGTGAQVASSNRWGDYSSMSIDPTDDCTFWFTQEYYAVTSSFNFNTRICSFRFPDCGAVCEPTEETEVSCADGLDNDCDNDVDCFDADCAEDPACICVPEPELCDDGLDNDCDGLVDCDDDDCAADDACVAPPGPENDLCEDAIEIVCPAGGGEVTVAGSTIAATFDDVGVCGTSNTSPGVWYRTTFDNGVLTASTCNQANFDTKLSVFEGECGALGCIAGNDDTVGCAGFTTELTWEGSGAEQLILVHGFGSATGDFDLTVSCEPFAENDICEDASGPLAVDSVTAGSTSAATLDEPPEIDCGTSVTAPGVWYTVEGTGNTMTASTCNDGNPATGGSGYDNKISVYCADCEFKECIGGQDDAAGCAGFSSQFSWATEPGATYNVFVHGFGSATGDFELAILDDGVPVPAGEANDCDGVSLSKEIVAGNDEDEDGAIDKVVEAGVFNPAEYSFAINYTNLNADGAGVVVKDVVPREWDVAYVPSSPVACSVKRADERRNLFSDNFITCATGTAEAELIFDARARCELSDPSCKPVECGAFFLNQGAAVWKGRTLLEGPTPPLCLAAVMDLNGGGLDYRGIGDEDGDGVSDYTEACIDFTDPCDAGSVGDDSCRDCLEAHDTAGCGNSDCQATVCSVDSFCCDVVWDGFCAAQADALCVPDICSAAGPFRPTTVEGGRLWESEQLSKLPNFTPKE